MLVQHPPQANESAHDFHVDLHGLRAAQDAGKHRDALLGEGVGCVARAAAR